MMPCQATLLTFQYTILFHLEGTPTYICLGVYLPYSRVMYDLHAHRRDKLTPPHHLPPPPPMLCHAMLCYLRLHYMFLSHL